MLNPKLIKAGFLAGFGLATLPMPLLSLPLFGAALGLAAEEFAHQYNAQQKQSSST